MYAALLVIHVIVAVLLVVVILIQRGRGGGLVESFSGVESMFGTRTSQFLTRITTVFAIVFMSTSVSLAFLAARQSRSLIDEKAISAEQEKAEGEGQPAGSEETAAQQEPRQGVESEELAVEETGTAEVEPGAPAVESQENIPE